MRRAAVSFTGGKDCHLALARARERADVEVVALACFHPPGEKRFKAHPVGLQEQQAAALGLPLAMLEVDAAAHEGSYLEAYRTAVRQLRAAHDVDMLITGDIDLVGSSKTNFMTDVCADAAVGVECWLPLWQGDREALLREMLRRGFEIHFSCVKSPFFDGSWVGRRLDADALEAMAKRVPEGLDVCGENGEYHTMVLGGPTHRYPLSFAASPPSSHELLEQRGQREGERWWVLAPGSALQRRAAEGA